ncbi:MAG TPA: hypothetical protein DC047_17260 [Blastocatellia bacterium]|nr:hypothetical protein [Blastocatellia bacterium]
MGINTNVDVRSNERLGADAGAEVEHDLNVLHFGAYHIQSLLSGSISHVHSALFLRGFHFFQTL